MHGVSRRPPGSIPGPFRDRPAPSGRFVPFRSEWPGTPEGTRPPRARSQSPSSSRKRQRETWSLAGSMAIGSGSVFGLSMGTSEAVGYIDGNGHITGMLNELAFAPKSSEPRPGSGNMALSPSSPTPAGSQNRRPIALPWSMISKNYSARPVPRCSTRTTAWTSTPPTSEFS